MSDGDSFIQEVSEEVRRDALVKTLRKYAVWIGAGLVLLVGGLSLNEYLKFSAQTAAETRGAAMQAALTSADVEASVSALQALLPEAGPALALAQLQLAGVQAQSGDRDAAAATLAAITVSPDADPLYVDIARLKLAMVGAGGVRPLAERRAVLERLATDGHPLRTLAEEQLALLALEEGDRDAALAQLSDILLRSDVSQAGRARISALVTALGGAVPEAGALTLPGDLDG